MQNQIILYTRKNSWVAQFVGPHAQEIIRLFGTDVLPLPFTPTANPELVRETVEHRNPDVFVSFA